MSQQSPPKSKPKLSVGTLYASNIRYEARKLLDLDSSNFIVPIRDQLIRLRQKRLPKDAEPLFAQELENFQKSGQDRDEARRNHWSLKPPTSDLESVYYEENRFVKNTLIEKIEEEIRACQKIAQQAKRLRSGNEPESTWMLFLRSNFFKTFDDIHDTSNSDVHPLQRWELQQDLYWNESKRYGDAIPHDGPPLTGPKPDLTYAFPILDTTKITAPYVSDPKVNDFSLEVLGELRTNKKVELRSAPTTKLHSSQTKKNLQLGNADLLCFPWAIVEAKKNEPNMKDHRAAGEFCYCQAANASAAALKLREDLMELAKDCPNTHDGLAIFAFTCVGPTVKLWVTHKIKSKAETITLMRCIWATSLELTWGAMALRMVIENMQEWVYHRVTPEIWRWIRMVRAAHPPQPCIPPGAVLPSQTRRAASCEPTRERKHATSPSPKTHAVETRRKSSPGSSHRQGHIHSLPIRTRKDSFGKNHSNKEEKRDSEGREDEREEEGDSSDATYEPSSTGEDDITEEDEEDFTDSTVESDNSEEEEEGYTAESEYSEDEAEKREDTQGQRSSSHQQRPDKAGSLGKNGRAKEYRSDEDHTEGRYRPKSDKSKGKDTPSPNRRRRSSHGSPSPSGWKSKFPEWKAYPRSLQVLLADFWEKNESNCEVALDILKRFFSFSWRHDDDFLLALSQLHDLSLVNKSRFEELVKLSSRVDQFEFQEELERVLELAVWEQEWDPDASIPIVL